MKISNEYPPNIEEIRAVVTPPKTAIFTYGETIHKTGNRYLDPAVRVHEGLHQLQQNGKPKERKAERTVGEVP